MLWLGRIIPKYFPEILPGSFGSREGKVMDAL